MPNELKLKTIGIYSNSERDSGLRIASEVAEFLTAHGADALNYDGEAPVDCVISLGGDGTFLRAARLAALTNTPVMGINLGRLGFLTDACAGGVTQSLKCLLSGEYILEKRLMLESGAGTERTVALNDALVSHSGSPKALMLKVDINGEHMDTFLADGILVSTPTGSTAYSLAAGGPVIKPGAEALAITPVCPHALHARSSVVASCDVITVRVISNGGALFMDGINSGEIGIGGQVEIRRSNMYTTIIKTQNKGFYGILREKMSWS
jgi:NAD+ kinase